MSGAQINFLDEIIVDNFAGGGGASTGIELATGRVVDIAVNHDPDAILMHKTNHPHTRHFKPACGTWTRWKSAKGAPWAWPGSPRIASISARPRVGNLLTKIYAGLHGSSCAGPERSVRA